MHLVQPPPLPDVPFARRAPVSPPPVPDELAPAGRFVRMLLFIPLPVVAFASALLLAKAYRSGGDYRHEVSHGFIRFFDTLVFCGATGVTLLVTVVTMCCAWRRLSGRARRAAVACVTVSGIVSGAAVGAAERAFRAGKIAAYARVNPSLLLQDCRTMSASRAAAMAAATQPTGVNQDWFTAGDARLPAYVRALRPRYVVVSDTHARVVMAVAPISGVHEEGFYVPLALGAESQRPVGPHVPISTNPAVFRFGW